MELLFLLAGWLLYRGGYPGAAAWILAAGCLWALGKGTEEG